MVRWFFGILYDHTCYFERRLRVVILRNCAVAFSGGLCDLVRNAKLCVLVSMIVSIGVTVCRMAMLYEMVFTDPS